MLDPSSIGLTADPSKEYCCLGWKLGMNDSNDEVERHIVVGRLDESSQDPLKVQELAWTQEPWAISDMLCVLEMMRCRDIVNPLSPKIDFYVDLLICATSWASNHKFMLLSKIFQETYYL